MKPATWTATRWVLLFASTVALALGGYLIYARAGHSTLEVILPCGHTDPYLITFGAKAGEHLESTSSGTYRVTIPDDGIRHLVEDMPSGTGFYLDWQEVCQGQLQEVSSRSMWQEETGTTAADNGLITYDYICGYSADANGRSVCESLLARATAERLAQSK